MVRVTAGTARRERDTAVGKPRRRGPGLESGKDTPTAGKSTTRRSAAQSSRDSAKPRRRASPQPRSSARGTGRPASAPSRARGSTGRTPREVPRRPETKPHRGDFHAGVVPATSTAVAPSSPKDRGPERAAGVDDPHAVMHVVRHLQREAAMERRLRVEAERSLEVWSTVGTSTPACKRMSQCHAMYQQVVSGSRGRCGGGVHGASVLLCRPRRPARHQCSVDRLN